MGGTNYTFSEFYHMQIVNMNYCLKAASHVINSRALTGEKPCINKTIHALLMLGNFQYDRTGATDLLPLRDVYCLALERA